MKIQSKLLIVFSLASLLASCKTNSNLTSASFTYVAFNENNINTLVKIEKDLSEELSKLCYEFYDEFLETESILTDEEFNPLPPDKYFICDLLDYTTEDSTYMGFKFNYQVEFNENTTIALSYLDDTSSNGYSICYTSSLTSSLVEKGNIIKDELYDLFDIENII